MKRKEEKIREAVATLVGFGSYNYDDMIDALEKVAEKIGGTVSIYNGKYHGSIDVPTMSRIKGVTDGYEVEWWIDLVDTENGTYYRF